MMRLANLTPKFSVAVALALATSTLAPSAIAQTCIRDRFGRIVCGQPVPSQNYPTGPDYQYNNRYNGSYRYTYPNRGDGNGGQVYPYDPRSNRVRQVPYNPNFYYPDIDYGNQQRYYSPRLDPSQVGLVINGFYQQYLGRDADPVGLSSYLRDYQNGKPLELIRREIAGSSEARNRR